MASYKCLEQLTKRGHVLGSELHLKFAEICLVANLNTTRSIESVYSENKTATGCQTSSRMSRHECSFDVREERVQICSQLAAKMTLVWILLALLIDSGYSESNGNPLHFKRKLSPALATFKFNHSNRRTVMQNAILRGQKSFWRFEALSGGIYSRDRKNR